jgi:precorrin-6Y C5,15-methyltransferase (decarboxylating)
MKQVTLIGAGCGPGQLTAEARRALERADLALGAIRLLEQCPASCEKRAAVRPKEIVTGIRETDGQHICVLFSGDSGFYSGARLLLPLLRECEVEVLPGVSSVQALAARLGRPWQDFRLCSAHGVDCDPVAEVCHGQPVLFLTGGAVTPATLCRELAEAGLADLPVTAGEALGGPGERIRSGTAGAFAARTFGPLSVLLAEAAPRRAPRTPGLPDALFQRLDGVPMTKQMVRAAALSLLAAGPEDICWDVGAGTGSVAVELALQTKAVWAVERDPAALKLAEENRRALGAWNLRLRGGSAPEALADLPRPDAVFVGGSGGALPAILQRIHGASPAARVCVSAISLDTLHRACEILDALGRRTEVVQVAVSRSRAAAGHRLMLAENPVYLVAGYGP